MSELKELTPEEKEKPYSKYYYMEPAKPYPEMYELIQPGKPMDSAKALLIENLNDLLNPGYMEVETGYCVLPNGAGYVAVNTKMPGVTVDMINWWYSWHSLEDLRYKIWWPQGHFGISISEEDRNTVLDPNTPMTLKFQGITHHVIEDAGGGVEKIAISFLTPEDFGFDMDRFKSPNVGTLVAANGLAVRADAPPGAPKIPAAMCHFIREIEGGIEYRTRFWLGYQIIDKKPKLLLPPGIRVPEIAPFGLAYHNIHEYANLRALLPKLYAEQKGELS
ncbi:DAPG hydrolase family protein [Sporomusa sp.]|uniref:DAPG hydrolase family protein n=1 Tax=Sporomusa sp. TaxID=2078658 RepID=UPI002BBDC8CE|nr:hypothetical protein [Sporomusa sp.]HWR45500.1 hypothetical protein [Sporomusa sp.]